VRLGVGAETTILTSSKDGDTIAFGEFLLENNVWGGPSEPHMQTIGVYAGTLRWSWSRLSPSSNKPYYPEVIYGKKPGRTSSTTSNLPAYLGDLSTIEVSLDASTRAEGKYNLAFDLWITGEVPSRESWVRKEDITHEVMIWLLWTPGLEARNIHGTVDDGYNTYHHRTHASGDWLWRFHQFTIAKQGIPSRINMTAFFEHLTNDGEDLKVLISIELGNEVWYGTGATTVNRMDVRITRKTAPDAITPAIATFTLICMVILGATLAWSIVKSRRAPNVHARKSIHAPACCRGFSTVLHPDAG